MLPNAWRMTSVFTVRFSCGQAAAAHARARKVLNGPEDPDAAPVQSAGAQVQNAAFPDQTVAVAARTDVVQAQNVEAVDLTAAGDHDSVAVHNGGAFPHVARALSGKVVAHNCAQADPDVARGSRFAQSVQVAQLARGDPFRPAAGSFPGVPAIRFVQVDLFSRAAPDLPQEFRFPLTVWWEQSAAVALAAPNR